MPSALCGCQLIQSPCVKIQKRFSPLLHPKIIVYILNTVPYTFPYVLNGEFVEQSRVSSVVGHFLYSIDLNVFFRGDIVRGNRILVTPRGERDNLRTLVEEGGQSKNMTSKRRVPINFSPK